MIAALIPARGGSKGIPGKNLAQVYGRPLISWTIEHAMESALIDSVYVATDCPKIGGVACTMGATWFIRSDESATDDAPTESVIGEFLECLDDQPEYVVLLQCTSPVRHPFDIDAAINQIQQSGADSLFSGRIVHGYTWTVDDGVPTPNYRTRQRRQDETTAVVEENGSIYVFKPQAFRTYKKRLGGVVDWYEMDDATSHQVDEWRDIEIVERELRNRHGSDILRYRQHAVRDCRHKLPGCGAQT